LNSSFLDSNTLLNRAIELHYSEIRAAVRRRGLSSNFATEVVHDLYLRLAEKPEALENKRSLSAFLCRAAVNLCIDRLRRNNFENRLFSGTLEEAAELASETAAPDYILEVEAQLRILRDAIGELPPRTRAIFALHRLNHMAPETIAKKFSISMPVVDRHLRRAIVHCLDRLQKTV